MVAMPNRSSAAECPEWVESGRQGLPLFVHHKHDRRIGYDNHRQREADSKVKTPAPIFRPYD